ncbi:hypothetical protein J2Y00_003566 [Deinococcus soli (ex Cha et al. 2016)]|uniref:Type I-C CRISPR-associated protein Cas8c/Csd1 n=1 Tax=Deinococcus soli (ex Cha et al. 2016) TaxID=1309411 RepID=A0AAE3XGX1_9DEIO|nr:type I-C CRISPR-associated protein Cas8c/Csd1 [Deinococcus soli (ex Cha et al. 2016)]MDR6219955.1 hypothetical protein [Deinococcus soli (ex Cha et al. 2016)]
MTFGASLASRLVAFDRRGPQDVRLHERRAVQWTVVLDNDGTIIRVLPHPKPPKGELPHLVLAPREAKARGNTVAPLLLTDNATYVLGLNKEGARKVNGAEKRAAYLTLLEQAASRHPDLAAALTGVQALTSDHIPGVQSSDLITFTIGGRNPHEHSEAQHAWITQQRGQDDLGNATDAVTGEASTLIANFPLLKGVPGGQHSLAFQSRNAKTFQRYGLSTLGVGASTAEATARAMTALASDPRTAHRVMGWDAILLHWLDHDAPDPWLALSDPTQEDVRAQLQAQAAGTGDETATVNLAVVRGNGARLVVLDHAQMPLRDAARHAQTYLRRTDQLPLWQAERALENTGGRVQTHLLPALHRHALLGDPLPGSVQRLLLTHWRKNLRLTRAQRALLALTLPEITVQDVSTIPEPLRLPYAMGRYAATAHQVHRRANPGVSMTITDRYLRLLTTSPARAYGQMERTLQAVLRGVRRSKPHLHTHLSAALAQASTDLTLPLPTTFTPEQQSALALGYEHETARQIAEAQARKAEMKGAQ